MSGDSLLLSKLLWRVMGYADLHISSDPPQSSFFFSSSSSSSSSWSLLADHLIVGEVHRERLRIDQANTSKHCCL